MQVRNAREDIVWDIGWVKWEGGMDDVKFEKYIQNNIL